MEHTCDHKHNYLIDVEANLSDPPEWAEGLDIHFRGKIFLKCINCKFIVRENDIIKYIESLEIRLGSANA